MLCRLSMRTIALALAALLAAAPATAADTLINHVNGVQVGADGKIQRFTGIVISDGGKVIQLIDRDHPLIRPADTVIDGKGRTLMPGLIDAHGHVTDLGSMALNLDLTGTSSLADLQDRLRNYAANHAGEGWIIGGGWNQELWPDKRFPSAADLDAAVPDRPVVLQRVDGHAVVANSAAMNAAGVTSSTPAPAGGRIENGLFVDNAQDLIYKAVPSPTAARYDEMFAKAQDILLGFGVTSVGAMSVSAADWDAFKRAGEAGTLQVRLMTYALGAPLAAAPHPTGWLYGDHLRMVGVKLFADGALGSRGAWLKQPYADKPDTNGLQFLTDLQLWDQGDRAAASGFQLAIHAIGDAANAQVIWLYEQMAKKYPGDRRWRIEHFQIVDPADIPRLKPAGIVASMQPTHQTSDRLMAEARLGPDRLAGAYAWQTVEKLGIPLAFGSDFPVELPNPFPGVAAAVSRQDAEGQPPGGWIPSEKLTLEQALAAFTRGAAYAGFSEDRIGSLDPGKWADFILVDRDPTQVDAQSLRATKVVETWVGGEKAWPREPSEAPGERGR